MVGFRNLAIHEYEKLELDVIQSVIEHGMDDIKKYADIISKINLIKWYMGRHVWFPHVDHYILPIFLLCPLTRMKVPIVAATINAPHPIIAAGFSHLDFTTGLSSAPFFSEP